MATKIVATLKNGQPFEYIFGDRPSAQKFKEVNMDKEILLTVGDGGRVLHQSIVPGTFMSCELIDLH